MITSSFKGTKTKLISIIFLNIYSFLCLFFLNSEEYLVLQWKSRFCPPFPKRWYGNVDSLQAFKLFHRIWNNNMILYGLDLASPSLRNVHRRAHSIRSMHIAISGYNDIFIVYYFRLLPVCWLVLLWKQPPVCCQRRRLYCILICSFKYLKI